MPVCSHCGVNYPDTEANCPSCSPHPAQFGPEHDLNLISVFRADDDLTARIIQGALTSNGIPAHIHNEQAAPFGTILTSDHGCWGEVMVPAAREAEALDVIRVYTTENAKAEAEAEEAAIQGPPEDGGVPETRPSVIRESP